MSFWPTATFFLFGSDISFFRVFWSLAGLSGEKIVNIRALYGWANTRMWESRLCTLTYLLIYLITYLFIYLLITYYLPSLALFYFILLALLYLLYFTYLLIPCSRDLLEKLTGFQLVKKFPTYYWTWRFITTVTSAATCPYHEPAWTSPYPNIPLPEVSILILFSHLCLGPLYR